ncbi:MAG: 3-phosphoshikimate 1-carboxyvinyltransferase [Thermoanaerobaculales bacterium]|jgi:3-phosphoshikimate 1-carboxyvinyltransferase|nr:3-phosphoshikimate 1-carboxyvinyltransferase [Thermoanaerobaculales bacterium]
MNSVLLPGPVGNLDADVRVPTSKSLTNRALIAAAAADGGEVLRPLDCEDTRLLADALRQAGWPVEWGSSIRIGPRETVSRIRVDLGNSGTGSRLILGLLACVPGSFTVDGTPRLRERPMAPLIEALGELGSTIESRDGRLPVTLKGGRLAGGKLRITPEVSSQFVSSLLLAAPLMTRGLDLEVLGTVPSRPYLDLTEQTLTAFGATVEALENRWRVEPGGIRPTSFAVEGDWSAMAFPAAAAAVAGGRVGIRPLDGESAQGDRAICGILRRAGVAIDFVGETVDVRGPADRPFDASLEDAPDAFPALAVVAAAGPPGTVLRGLDHLRHKECDRLAVMLSNLGRLGAGIEREQGEIRVVRPMDRHRKRRVAVTAAADHRIAMAMAVAGLATGGLELDDADCVGKSFPGFWSMWKGLLDGSGELR